MEGDFSVTFQQDGSQFTGTIEVSSSCVSAGTVSGSLDGNTISFGAVKGAETVAFDGVLSGDTMSGDYQSGPACGNDRGTWTATRN